MKRNMALLGVLLLGISVFAKNENGYQSEEDSIECLKKFSLYSLNLKKRMYDYAVEPWNYMFTNCPQTSVKLYSDGIKIYHHYYSTAKTKLRKSEVVDTIMMIYNQRIQYYSSHPKYPEGWILGRKALDLMKYRRGQPQAVKDAYDWFSKSFELQGDKSEDAVLFTWLKTSKSLLDHGDLNEQQFLNDFLAISTVLDVQLAKASPKVKPRILKIRKGCEDVLIRSGAGGCGVVEPLLTDQFNADSENPDNIARILNLLDKLECNQSALYFKAVEKNYAISPSHSSAHHLAKMFVKKGDFTKAAEYYHKAIVICDDNEAQSTYNYELAVLEFAHNKNYQKARQYAREAISLHGDWGKPYLLLGNIYAAGSKNYGKNDFEQATVYWVAIDNFSKARQIDPECAAEAEKQIALYSKYIPDQETGFFHGLQEGDSYKLGAWINESTKVRFR
ncbi:tetratricopeptide repeat protein [Saccharicrinis sp. GN24d3]|uniref:tetratricopeptide repeat protein n=1 Tax=Saccharicrinis sp. GN24d3 TaxID=3458416 RepID=UPI004037482B